MGEESVDLTIAATDRLLSGAPRVDVQLKATSANVLRKETLAFRLKRKNYDDLQAKTYVPRILVVLRIPEDLDLWVQQTEDELIRKYAAYWFNLADLPDVEQTAVTVAIPRGNLFTSKVLKSILKKRWS